jgi:hypothetical protein
MAILEVAAKDPAYSAEVGWHRELGGYWFVVYDHAHHTHEHGGVEDARGHADPLPGLYDLVAASVGVIDWAAPSSMAALRQLRDSPWREQAEDDAETPASLVLRQALDRVA